MVKMLCMPPKSPNHVAELAGPICLEHHCRYIVGTLGRHHLFTEEICSFPLMSRNQIRVAIFGKIATFLVLVLVF